MQHPQLCWGALFIGGSTAQDSFWVFGKLGRQWGIVQFCLCLLVAETTVSAVTNEGVAARSLTLMTRYPWQPGLLADLCVGLFPSIILVHFPSDSLLVNCANKVVGL